MTSHASQGFRALQLVRRLFPFIKKRSRPSLCRTDSSKASDASQGLKALLSDPEFSSQASRPRQDRCSRLEHPARAPSKETKGLEPLPNPNWHPSGLDKHRLKKTKGLEPPPNPNSPVWSGQVQHADPNPLVQDWKQPVRAPSKESDGLEPLPNPNWHPSGLDKSSLQTQILLFQIGSIQLRHRLKKTKGLEPPSNPNWHLWS